VCQFWSPPWFRIRRGASGWGVRGEEVHDLCKAIVAPGVKGVWGGECPEGGECHFSDKRRDVIPICILPVKAPGRGASGAEWKARLRGWCGLNPSAGVRGSRRNNIEAKRSWQWTYQGLQDGGWW